MYVFHQMRINICQIMYYDMYVFHSLCGSCKKPPRTSLQCGYIYKLQGRGEYSVWPASSVGRASGRYPGGHGFEPRSGRIFFSLCNN